MVAVEGATPEGGGRGRGHGHPAVDPDADVADASEHGVEADPVQGREDARHLVDDVPRPRATGLDAPGGELEDYQVPSAVDKPTRGPTTAGREGDAHRIAAGNAEGEANGDGPGDGDARDVASHAAARPRRVLGRLPLQLHRPGLAAGLVDAFEASVLDAGRTQGLRPDHDLQLRGELFVHRKLCRDLSFVRTRGAILLAGNSRAVG